MLEEEFELGANAITTGHEDGLLIIAQVVGGGEEPKGSEELPLLLSSFDVSAYVAHESCCSACIYAGIFVCEFACHRRTEHGNPRLACHPFSATFTGEKGVKGEDNDGISLNSLLPSQKCSSNIELMMKPILLLSTCLALLAPGEKLTHGMSPTELAKIAPAVEGLIQEDKLVGASVLVIRHGKTVYFEQFGQRDREQNLPMEADTLFRIYSMTKGPASALALMLCEEGTLSLDDPVSHYLPSFSEQTVTIEEGETDPARRATTVRDLLRHTSGFGPGNSPQYREQGVRNPQATLSEMSEKLGPLPLAAHPGEQWVYSFSSDVLAAVIASAAGKSFPELLQERVLTPLGMSNTFYQVPPDKASRLSTLYRNKEGVLEPSDQAETSNFLKDPAFKGGGSGLVSTIKDYAKFLQMISNNGVYQGERYLRADTVELMRTNQLPRAIPCIGIGQNQKRHGIGFGLGFSVKYLYDDRWDAAAPVGEYGWGGAASTHYWLSPSHDLIVVTMEQTMPYTPLLETTLKPIIYQAIKE